MPSLKLLRFGGTIWKVWPTPSTLLQIIKQSDAERGRKWKKNRERSKRDFERRERKERKKDKNKSLKEGPRKEGREERSREER